MSSTCVAALNREHRRTWYQPPEVSTVSEPAHRQKLEKEERMSTSFLRRSASALMFVLLCLALGVGTAPAQSQASTGQITGTVTDPNGAAVANASVTVTNNETGFTRTATASEEGIYTIVLLPPGTYKLVAKAANFADTTIDNVVVNVGRVVEVKISLG